MEPTKTWWYVSFDLAVKALQAFSVLALGVAGLRWQRANAADAERRRFAEQEEQRQQRLADQEEQRLLPMFDSLASLEMALDEMLAAEIKDVGDYQNIADALAWRNMKLYVPPDAKAEVNLPELSVYGVRENRWEGIPENPGQRFQRLPVKSAVGLTCEFIKIMLGPAEQIFRSEGVEAVFLSYKDGDVWIEGDGMSLGPRRRPHPRSRHFPAPELGQAWRQCLPTCNPGATASMLMIDRGGREKTIRELLIALRSETARIQTETLMQHPALAEKYLNIRNSIITNKLYRRPSSPAPTTPAPQPPSPPAPSAPVADTPPTDKAVQRAALHPSTNGS